MVVTILQMLGWLGFLVGTVAAGGWLRSHPGKRNAERASRMLHLVFWKGVVPPAVCGVLDPGLTGFDQVLGLSPWPGHPFVSVVGALGLVGGVYLLVASSDALGWLGDGASAFWLTWQLVAGSIYKRTRNPMGLGIYLAAFGIGLVVGSTTMTLATLLVVMPVHVFYLKYFEEYELELRLGQSYAAYRREVPFLVPRWSSSQSPE